MLHCLHLHSHQLSAWRDRKQSHNLPHYHDMNYSARWILEQRSFMHASNCLNRPVRRWHFMSSLKHRMMPQVLFWSMNQRIMWWLLAQVAIQFDAHNNSANQATLSNTLKKMKVGHACVKPKIMVKMATHKVMLHISSNSARMFVLLKTVAIVGWKDMSYALSLLNNHLYAHCTSN